MSKFKEKYFLWFTVNNVYLENNIHMYNWLSDETSVVARNIKKTEGSAKQ